MTPLTYTYTLVLEGCEDEEFRDPSRRPLEAFHRGELTISLGSPPEEHSTRIRLLGRRLQTWHQSDERPSVQAISALNRCPYALPKCLPTRKPEATFLTRAIGVGRSSAEAVVRKNQLRAILHSKKEVAE
jgi:hypothetical protein